MDPLGIGKNIQEDIAQGKQAATDLIGIGEQKGEQLVDAAEEKTLANLKFLLDYAEAMIKRKRVKITLEVYDEVGPQQTGQQ